MNSFYSKAQSYLTPKTKAFLKRSLFFAFLYATLLYSLVRLFFYDFPFTIGEGIELHTKIWMVVWLFILACKLLCAVIISAEYYFDTMHQGQVNFAPILKNTILVMLATTMACATEDRATDHANAVENSGNLTKEQAVETELAFQ